MPLGVVWSGIKAVVVENEVLRLVVGPEVGDSYSKTKPFQLTKQNFAFGLGAWTFDLIQNMDDDLVLNLAVDDALPSKKSAGKQKGGRWTDR